MASLYYILVADDDPTLRHVLARVVRSVVPHAHVIEASDGVQALAALQQVHFGLVITDYHMPGASGLEIVKAVRAQAPALPVVVVSAHREIEAAVMAAGATYFLAKPFTLDQLTTLVRAALPTT